MKTIKPYKVPTSEGMCDVSVMAVKSIYDNLEDNVTFQADFFIQRGRELIHTNQVNVSLGADTYKTWDATMEGAYKLVAKKIGLTIEAEYQEPVEENLGDISTEALNPNK